MQTLDLNEAALMLRIHPVTLLKKVRSGEIPAAKPGKRYVFLDLDLVEYVRSNYVWQALQSDSEEVIKCHSTSAKTRRSGGSKSPSAVESRYNEVLKPPTRSKQENSRKG